MLFSAKRALADPKKWTSTTLWWVPAATIPLGKWPGTVPAKSLPLASLTLFTSRPRTVRHPVSWTSRRVSLVRAATTWWTSQRRRPSHLSLPLIAILYAPKGPISENYYKLLIIFWFLIVPSLLWPYYTKGTFSHLLVSCFQTTFGSILGGKNVYKEVCDQSLNRARIHPCKSRTQICQIHRWRWIIRHTRCGQVVLRSSWQSEGSLFSPTHHPKSC